MSDEARDDTSVFHGSGNVFADIGLANPEKLQLKAGLALLVNKAIEQRGLTEKQAARLLGVTPANITEISRGGLRKITVHRLLNFLVRLDYRLMLTVSTESISKEIDMGKYALEIKKLPR